MKNNFSRSNVNESTLDISSPLRSSFNLSHNSHVSLPLGVLLPCNFEPLLPTDVLQGSLNPQLQIEKIMTPSLGRTRLDTHTFVVNARRVNRDFLTLRGDNTGSKPNFDIFRFYGNLLAALVGYSSVTKLFTVGQEDTHLSSTIAGWTNGSWASNATKLKGAVIATYQSLLKESDCDKYGWLRDFYSIEIQRLSSIPSYAFAGDDIWKNVPQAICDVLQPYCGPGSQLDMLGYPIVTINSAWGGRISRAFSIFVSSSMDLFDQLAIQDIFNLSASYLPESPDDEPSLDVELTKRVDETPLRVVYAVWYDYFRNYHVEKRANFLDPDLFGKKSILNLDLVTEYNFGIERFQQLLQLVLPKYRMYARDYLTTVETEDKFRFVYTPITDGANVDAPGEVNFMSIDQDFYNEIVKIGLPDFATDSSIFPLPYFSGTGENPSVTTASVLRSDLQTMRRSGMLEKWLARNYFYPDTYVGQLLARYQVTPSDVAILNAEYIGGNESFLADEQITANVTTDSTPMGQRVLKADVGLSDSFTYSATDYCYLVSFISLMPLVSYDSPNMHLHEITSADFPDPEFAEDTRVSVRTCDLLRGFDGSNTVIGYVPRYYQYRVHADETHGRYLTDYRSYNWFRDWYNMNFTDFEEELDYQFNTFKRDFTLNPYSLRVHLEPDAFLGLRIWSDIAFGKVDIQCHIQRPLPAAVEFI